MLLVGFLVLLTVGTVAVSSLLGLIGGTSIDLNAVLGAAAFVIGVVVIAFYALTSPDETSETQ